MFTFVRTPADDGIGVAFTDARVDLSDAQPSDDRTANVARVQDAIGASMAVVRQVHGNTVLVVDSPEAAVGREADALITGTRGLAVAVRVADCIPVLLADASAGLVAAAHAGRAGLLNGVLGATVDALRDLGATQLRAWIGPHVCGACYEVEPDLARAFAEATGVEPVPTWQGTLGIDLGAAARRQLEAATVDFVSVEACTRHSPGLHSYRRDGAAAGRSAGLIWLSA